MINGFDTSNLFSVLSINSSKVHNDSEEAGHQFLLNKKTRTNQPGFYVLQILLFNRR
jgi:hypothetical protein